MTTEEMERAIARLFEGQDVLTGKVSELTDDVADLRGAVDVMREQANADRAEIRAAVGTMLTFAESMAENVRLLTKLQQSNGRRIENVENRLDAADLPSAGDDEG